MPGKLGKETVLDCVQCISIGRLVAEQSRYNLATGLFSWLQSCALLLHSLLRCRGNFLPGVTCDGLASHRGALHCNALNCYCCYKNWAKPYWTHFGCFSRPVLTDLHTKKNTQHFGEKSTANFTMYLVLLFAD